jgi:hypothetical protein
VVQRIFHDVSVFDEALQLHLEKVISAEVVHVLRAVLDVIYEHLNRIERVTKLALACHTMFETFGIHLQLLDFDIKLIVLLFLLGHSLTEDLIRFNYFL